MHECVLDNVLVSLLLGTGGGGGLIYFNNYLNTNQTQTAIIYFLIPLYLIKMFSR